MFFFDRFGDFSLYFLTGSLLMLDNDSYPLRVMKDYSSENLSYTDLKSLLSSMPLALHYLASLRAYYKDFHLPLAGY